MRFCTRSTKNTLSFINLNRPLPPMTIEDMNKQEEFRDRNYLNPEIATMFHALGLIESYGSGIRRAKRAMADNGDRIVVMLIEKPLAICR